MDDGDVPPNLASRLLYDAIIKDPASEHFKLLPDFVLYQDYYKVIARPIALADIYRMITTTKYSLVDMTRDLRRMVSNAKKYNKPDAQVYQDALALERTIRRAVKEIERDGPEDEDEDSLYIRTNVRDRPQLEEQQRVDAATVAAGAASRRATAASMRAQRDDERSAMDDVLNEFLNDRDILARGNESVQTFHRRKLGAFTDKKTAQSELNNMKKRVTNTATLRAIRELAIHDPTNSVITSGQYILPVESVILPTFARNVSGTVSNPVVETAKQYYERYYENHPLPTFDEENSMDSFPPSPEEVAPIPPSTPKKGSVSKGLLNLLGLGGILGVSSPQPPAKPPSTVPPVPQPRKLTDSCGCPLKIEPADGGCAYIRLRLNGELLPVPLKAVMPSSYVLPDDINNKITAKHRRFCKICVGTSLEVESGSKSLGAGSGSAPSVSFNISPRGPQYEKNDSRTGAVSHLSSPTRKQKKKKAAIVPLSPSETAAYSLNLSGVLIPQFRELPRELLMGVVSRNISENLDADDDEAVSKANTTDVDTENDDLSARPFKRASPKSSKTASSSHGGKNVTPKKGKLVCDSETETDDEMETGSGLKGHSERARSKAMKSSHTPPASGKKKPKRSRSSESENSGQASQFDAKEHRRIAKLARELGVTFEAALSLQRSGGTLPEQTKLEKQENSVHSGDHTSVPDIVHATLSPLSASTASAAGLGGRARLNPEERDSQGFNLAYSQAFWQAYSNKRAAINAHYDSYPSLVRLAVKLGADEVIDDEPPSSSSSFANTVGYSYTVPVSGYLSGSGVPPHGTSPSASSSSSRDSERRDDVSPFAFPSGAAAPLSGLSAGSASGVSLFAGAPPSVQMSYGGPSSTILNTYPSSSAALTASANALPPDSCNHEKWLIRKRLFYGETHSADLQNSSNSATSALGSAESPFYPPWSAGCALAPLVVYAVQEHRRKAGLPPAPLSLSQDYLPKRGRRAHLSSSSSSVSLGHGFGYLAGSGGQMAGTEVSGEWDSPMPVSSLSTSFSSVNLSSSSSAGTGGAATAGALAGAAGASASTVTAHGDADMTLAAAEVPSPAVFGLSVDVKDAEGIWWLAQVVDIRSKNGTTGPDVPPAMASHIKVRYSGWSAEDDEWIECPSPSVWQAVVRNVVPRGGPLRTQVMQCRVALARTRSNPRAYLCPLCQNKESGNLIFCDAEGCGRAFHMQCLRPRMEKVPQGDWFCEMHQACYKKGTKGSAKGKSKKVGEPVLAKGKQKSQKTGANTETLSTITKSKPKSKSSPGKELDKLKDEVNDLEVDKETEKESKMKNSISSTNTSQSVSASTTSKGRSSKVSKGKSTSNLKK